MFFRRLNGKSQIIEKIVPDTFPDTFNSPYL